MASKCEMRAVAGVEDGIVFEDDDGGFDSIQCVTTGFENAPSGMQRAKAARFAGINGVIGNVPGAAVNNEGWSHGFRE